MPDPTFLTKSGGDPVADFEGLIRRLNNPPDTAVLEAGKLLIADIRQRTFSGIDIKGDPFTPYSPAYERRKGQISVDLYSKNAPPHMLDELTAQVANGALEIGIFGDTTLAERARVNNEGGKLRVSVGRLSKRIKSRFGQSLARKLGFGNFTIPARPWLAPSPAALEKAAQIIGNAALKP